MGLDGLPNIFELLSELPEGGTEIVLDKMSQHHDQHICDTGLFLSLMLSPLTHRTTGESWPDSTRGEEKKDAFIVWLVLTQKRYEFAQGNRYVAIEIHDICKKLELWTPPEIMEWLADNPKQATAPSNHRSRKKQITKRGLRAEQKKLVEVFGISPEMARGWILQRLEASGTTTEKGTPIGDYTLVDYIQRDGEKTDRESYMLAATKSVVLEHDEREEWRQILIKRYPDEVQDHWRRMLKG